jgi:hypothetical protein
MSIMCIMIGMWGEQDVRSYKTILAKKSCFVCVQSPTVAHNNIAKRTED